MVTNKSSNILEDLEILRILAKIVPDYAQSLDEEGITKAAFDLLFAFDEVISLGYKENVTLQQVRQNTEMESHEETQTGKQVLGGSATMAAITRKHPSTPPQRVQTAPRLVHIIV